MELIRELIRNAVWEIQTNFYVGSAFCHADFCQFIPTIGEYVKWATISRFAISIAQPGETFLRLKSDK